MLAGRRIAAFVALLALSLVASGAQAGAADPAAPEMYWLGPYFAGMRLTGTSELPDSGVRTYSYGDCELPEGEGGCSVPAQVQNFSSCERNPIALDRLPARVFLVRGGGLAAEYEQGGVDVGTGARTVTLWTHGFELMGAALRDFRLRSQPAPEPLGPPVYPLPVLRELVRVTSAGERLDRVGAIARAVDLPVAEVMVRLRIAELLGPDALAGVPPPTMSTATVEHLRQLAFRSQFDLPRAARGLGISKAALRRKLDRVRGLTGAC